MSMFRWDPSKDMMSLKQAVDKLFEQSIVRPSGFTLELGGGSIPVDIWQTENDVIVKATIPGVSPEAVDISVTREVLTIKAERKDTPEIKDKDYIRKENRYGMITRSINLPAEVKAEEAVANFENGVLTLKLPKSEQMKPKQIRIQNKPEENTTLPE